MQQALQAKTTTLHAYEDQAVQFDLRPCGRSARLTSTSTRRRIPTSSYIKNTNRDGHIPYGGTFGFSNAVEIPMPLDNRTTDLKTALEWSNGKGLLRFGWDGSTFENNIGNVVWDNPLVYGPDASGAPSQGRHTSWPTTP